MKLVRDGEPSDAPLKPFRFYGPTCDSLDHMPGPFWLPDDVGEGDYVEIGMLGAYGVAMATRFNGYGELDAAIVEDAPMASMYGLAPRSIPTPRGEDRYGRQAVARPWQERAGAAASMAPQSSLARGGSRRDDASPATPRPSSSPRPSSTSTSPPTTRGR